MDEKTPTIRELRDMNETARCEYVAAREALRVAEESYRVTMEALADRLHANEEKRS